MGNVVNQFIAANQPNIVSLQNEINALNATITNQNSQIKSYVDNYQKKLKIKNDLFATAKNVSMLAASGAGLSFNGSKIPPDGLVADWLSGKIPYFFPGAGWTNLQNDYRKVSSDLKQISTLNTALKAKNSNDVAMLSEKQKALATATNNFNEGLKIAQQTEDASATSASTNTVNEAQANNPEIIKAKLEASATSEKTKETSKNATILIICVSAIALIGVVLYIFRSSK